MDETEKPTSAGRERRIANLKPFQKGQSGNPSGRSRKVAAAEDIAQDNTEKALKKLVKLIDSPDDRVALAAANAVLDRSMGKPKQSITTTSKKEATDYSTDELLEIARMGRARTPSQVDGEREPDRIQ